MLKYNGSILKVNNGQSVIGSVTFSNTRVNFISGSCSKQTLSFGSTFTRVQFMVLPKCNYTSQLGTCNDGIGTGYGCSVFWVTEYTIDSDGALHVKGRKAAYDYSSASSNSGWPTLNTSTMYYYASQTFGGVTTEAHKFGVGVPEDAIAVMIVYKNHSNSGITANTINTDKAYNGIQDSVCGMCKDSSVLNSIVSLAVNTPATYDISGSNMVYPISSSRTILGGPREFLQSL